MQNNKSLAMGAAMLSAVFLGTLGVFVRNVSVDEYVMTLARLGFGFVFLSIFLLLKGEFKNIKLKNISIYVVLTGILLALTSVCYIKAITLTSLATAVFLLYLGPLVAVGILSLALKERFNLINLSLMLLAFLGFLCLLEFRWDFNVEQSKGYIWGLSSALCYALYVIFNQKISEDVCVWSRSFYQLLIGTLTVVPFLNGSILFVPSSDWIWLLSIGLFQGFLAFTFIIFALKNLTAVEYGTISYAEPLVATLIGLALYSEVLTFVQVMGCVVIFFGGLIQLVLLKNKS